MRNRWAVLALVVIARTTVGFQFQSVAAVGPFLVADLGLSYADLGTLIGFYLLPGVVLALPGGLLGTRFGDRAVMLLGLGLMTVGGAGVGTGESWALAAAGRLVSGAGAVLLNMQLAKIVTDWFAEKELATALGLMLTTWPLGIWLGLASLGALAEATTWRMAIFATTLSAALAFGLMLLLYRAPAPDADGSPTRPALVDHHRARDRAHPGGGHRVDDLECGLHPVPELRAEAPPGAGRDPCSARTSPSGWASLLSIATVPLGGVLLDRVRRRDAVMAVSLVGSAAACGAFALGGPAVFWSVLLGLLIAPVAGVVALAGEVLSRPGAATRASGSSTRSSTRA